MRTRRLSKVRREQFAADPHCRYCRKPFDRLGQSCIDHVQPRQHGGGNGRGNLVLTCKACNRRKAGMTPQELMAWCYQVWTVAHAEVPAG